MIDTAQAASSAARSDRLKIHRPEPEAANSACWLINGFPATILIWTAEEWSELTVRPQNAQQIPNGTWCLLRMD